MVLFCISMAYLPDNITNIMTEYVSTASIFERFKFTLGYSYLSKIETIVIVK